VAQLQQIIFIAGKRSRNGAFKFEQYSIDAPFHHASFIT